jgi:hypothetical protein
MYRFTVLRTTTLLVLFMASWSLPVDAGVARWRPTAARRVTRTFLAAGLMVSGFGLQAQHSARAGSPEQVVLDPYRTPSPVLQRLCSNQALQRIQEIIDPTFPPQQDARWTSQESSGPGQFLTRVRQAVRTAGALPAQPAIVYRASAPSDGPNSGGPVLAVADVQHNQVGRVFFRPVRLHYPDQCRIEVYIGPRGGEVIQDLSQHLHQQGSGDANADE